MVLLYYTIVVLKYHNNMDRKEKERIDRKIKSALSSENSKVSFILSKLELAPLISPRRTFSPDSMLKAFIFMDLKKIKSYRKLRNYLHGEVDDRRNIGFDDRIPTHQDMSNFMRKATEDYKEKIAFVSEKIRSYSMQYFVPLDIAQENSKKVPKAAKLGQDIINGKMNEINKFANKELLKKFKFASTYHNAKYSNKDFLNSLYYTATTHNFVQSGSALFRIKENGPSERTMQRNLSKYSYKELSKMLMEEIKETVKMAKRRRIITGEKVAVAIDATDLPFYGNLENAPYAVNADHQNKGTSYAFKFVELAIVTHGMRLVLCVIPKLVNGEMHDIVIDLLKFAKSQVNIDTVLLDRGYYSRQDMHAIDDEGLFFIMPMKSGTHAFERLDRIASDILIVPDILDNFTGIAMVDKESEKKFYTITNRQIKATDYNLAKYISNFYSRRWQIESDFSGLKQSMLARTRSLNYNKKYLLFAFGTILFNFWVLLSIALEFMGLAPRKNVPKYIFLAMLEKSLKAAST